MTIEVLDPTHEGDSREFNIASGLKELKGAKVGLISNGKRGNLTLKLQQLYESKLNQLYPSK